MSTDPITFESRPSLRRAVLILAFAGWNDAGASATTAVRYLTEQLIATRFASIDPEEFYDFSVQRPQVRLTEGTSRQIQWPSYDLYYGGGLGAGGGVFFWVGA